MERTRIHFIGDELVAGYGDARALGWTGRVLARSRKADLEAYTLAVPGENTAQLALRWHEEVSRRSDPAGVNRLVIGIGVADVLTGLSTARSRLALANILDTAAQEQRPTLVLGPPPLPIAEPDAVAALSRAMAEVCHRRSIPYVQAFDALRNHAQWEEETAAVGGAHPAQAGYGLLAWLVLHRGWYQWLGIPEPTAI